MYKTRLAQWGYVKNLKKTREIDRQAGANGLASPACSGHIRSVSPTAGREAATPAPTARRDSNEEELSPTQRYLNLSRCGTLSPTASSFALTEFLTALEKPWGASLKAFTDTVSTRRPTSIGSPSPSDDFANTATRITVNRIAFTEAEAPFCDPIESDLSLLFGRGLSPDSSNIYSGEPMDIEPGRDWVQQDLGLSFGGGHSPDSLDLSCWELTETEAVDGQVQQDTRPLFGSGATADLLGYSRARPIEPRTFLLRSDNTSLSEHARGLDYHALAWLCQGRKDRGSNELLPSTFLGRHCQSLKGKRVPTSSPFAILSHASSTSLSCDQIRQDVRTMPLQVTEPVNLTSRVGADDVSSWVLVNPTELALGSKCHQAMSRHCISLAGLAPSTQQPRSLLNGTTQEALALSCTAEGRGEAWRWTDFCFEACIQLDGGDSESSTRSLAEAATLFEDMLTKRDHLIFTAVHMTITILQMHDQSQIAESVVGSAVAVAQRLLKPDDPIRLTLEWEAAAAGCFLSESSLGSQILREIYTGFEKELTLEHPWTITVLYNLAWMLLYEGSFAEEDEDSQLLYAEASDLLQMVYVASCASLGPTHMQSITALTTLARAQSNLGKDEEATETYKKAIHDCKHTLGRHHPFRLEAKRRLALMYGKRGQKEEMEHLYWDVLQGRVLMLGRHHPFTVGMKHDLIMLLKDLKKWEDNGPLQRQICDLFEKRNGSYFPARGPLIDNSTRTESAGRF
jgi:hypothetical protein